MLCCAGTAAHAQLGASVTAVSDYRFRGVSLSDHRPALQAAVNYDATGGWYLGASLSQVALNRGRRDIGVVGYAGYVIETAKGPSWDLGAVALHFAGASSYDYFETYAGLVADRWNARVYLSPDYFGRGVASAYLECNGNVPLGEQMRLLGHAGVLAGHGGRADSDAGKARLDMRLGIGYGRGAADLQIAWVAASPDGPYPAVYDARRTAWLFSASYSF